MKKVPFEFIHPEWFKFIVAAGMNSLTVGMFLLFPHTIMLLFMVIMGIVLYIIMLPIYRQVDADAKAYQESTPFQKEIMIQMSTTNLKYLAPSVNESTMQNIARDIAAMRQTQQQSIYQDYGNTMRGERNV